LARRLATLVAHFPQLADDVPNAQILAGLQGSNRNLQSNDGASPTNT